MFWLGANRGHAADWVTQRWVQFTGRRVSLAREPWLEGPVGSVEGIGIDFFEHWGRARGLEPRPPRAGDGLFENFEILRGPQFSPSEVDPRVVDFYTRTADFELDLRAHWAGVFTGLGWLVGRLFARRLAQLDLSTSDGEYRDGVCSRIVRLADDGGRVRHVGWIRSSAHRGRPLFVGEYAISRISGHDGPCVKVVFPLPNGNAMVFLEPRVEPGGGLSLVSDGTRFGDSGFYFTLVAGDGEIHVRHVRTMKERLCIRPRGEELEARHEFEVFGARFLELEYRIARRSRSSGARARSEPA